MKERKENVAAHSGFTLVELVVVIAILGILAGVAYPAYTGYITKANDAKVLNTLSSILTSIESAAATVGASVTEVEIVVDYGWSLPEGTKGYTVNIKTDGSPDLNRYNFTNLPQEILDFFDSAEQLSGGMLVNRTRNGGKTPALFLVVNKVPEISDLTDTSFETYNKSLIWTPEQGWTGKTKG